MYNVYINHCTNNNGVPADVINELVNLYLKGTITSEELATIIKTVSAVCIEQNINNQLNSIIEKSFSSKHLSAAYV